MSTVTRIPNQGPALTAPARRARAPRRRTAVEAACQSATALAVEIRHDRRVDHLTRYARVLTRALAAMGVGATPPRPDAIPSQPARASHSPLSVRELQVLTGISQGKSNAHIGRELLISEDTVKTHTRRIFRKLHAHDRAHAAAIALRTGLIR